MEAEPTTDFQTTVTTTGSIFRAKFRAADVPENNEHECKICKKSPEFDIHNGSRFQIGVNTNKDDFGDQKNLGLYLLLVKGSPPTTLSYILTIIGKHVTFYRDYVFLKKFDDSVVPWGAPRVMNMERIVKDYCVDGEFTFQLDVDYVRQTIQHRIGALCDLKFTDFTVICCQEEIACHKFVLAKESKLVHRQLTDPSMPESTTNTMVMTHYAATETTVRLFIRAIYEGWIEHLMDKHAVGLLRLAHHYECDCVASFAIDACKRQLNDDTFWITCAIAVEFKNTRPTLLHACAQYASKPRRKYDELCIRDDNKTAEHSHVLMRAIAKLKKEKVVKKKPRKINECVWLCEDSEEE